MAEQEIMYADEAAEMPSGFRKVDHIHKLEK